jgi:hypothetical protein
MMMTREKEMQCPGKYGTAFAYFCFIYFSSHSILTLINSRINLNDCYRYFFPEPSACEKCMPDMSYSQRVMGFVGCAGLGYALSLIGSLTLMGGFTDKNVTNFATLYALGNIIALCATGFLMGPKKQCHVMFKPRRFYTTCFYLIMIVVVFSVAVAPFEMNGKIYLVLFLLFIQICAAVWYSASYIPYGRDMLSGILRRIYICAPCYMVYDAIQEKQKANSGGLFSSKA